jgi:hypothetical protein
VSIPENMEGSKVEGASSAGTGGAGPIVMAARAAIGLGSSAVAR